VLEPTLERTVAARAVEDLISTGDTNRCVTEAVGLFRSEFAYLKDNTSADVLLRGVPRALADLIDPDLRSPAADPTAPAFDFHDMLKAHAPEARRRRKSKPGQYRSVQDEATRAWNFHTALFYKARGLLWRLVRESARLTTCYIGVSFYRSLDRYVSEGQRIAPRYSFYM